ncbi:MAG: response regulator [Microthrixaceae bacterium]|nr:response regulator [Microthrixaceae bacterium]
MEYVLIATDSDALAEDLDATLGDDRCEVGRVHSGAEVSESVRTRQPDLVVLDLQIGNMGGMATSLHLRNEAGGGRLAPQNILLLLDRTADVFLARESEADGWMIKPIDSFRLRRAAQAVAEGRSWREHADGTIETDEPVA